MEVIMTIEELSKLSEKEIILFFAMMTDEEKLFWRQEQINNAIEMEQKNQAEQEQKDWAFVEDWRSWAKCNSVFNTQERKLGELFYDFKQLVMECIKMNDDKNSYRENDFLLMKELSKSIVKECERYGCATQLHDYIVKECL
jgi:hypothetical protein